MKRFSNRYQVAIMGLLFCFIPTSLWAQSGRPLQRLEPIQKSSADNDETIAPAGTLPNLRPFKPADWDDIIVISTVAGDRFDAVVITPQDTIFVDANSILEDAPITNSFFLDLFLDGEFLVGFVAGPSAAGITFLATDHQIAPLPPGRHTLELVVDSENTIPESNENDNRFLKEFVVGGPNFRYIPQYGAGSGLSSTITVSGISPNEPVMGEIFFFNPDGTPIDDSSTLVAGGTAFDLMPLGSQTFLIPADTDPLIQGPALVASDGPVSVVVRFNLPGFGLAGVPGAPPIRGGVVPIRQLTGRDTGIAIQNTSGQPIDVEISLRNEMGQQAAPAGTIGSPVIARQTLAVGARTSELLTSLFNLPNAFFESELDGRGAVRITSTNGTFAAVALELAQGAGFTVLPVEAFPIYDGDLVRGDTGQLRETAQAVGPGINEIMGEVGDGVDLYQVSFDKTVAVTFSTIDFGTEDANLFLFDVDGKPLAANDDSGLGGLNSRIQMKLPPGVYFIGVAHNNTTALDAMGNPILDNDGGVIDPEGVLADWQFNSRPLRSYRILIDAQTARP